MTQQKGERHEGNWQEQALKWVKLPDKVPDSTQILETQVSALPQSPPLAAGPILFHQNVNKGLFFILNLAFNAPTNKEAEMTLTPKNLQAAKTSWLLRARASCFAALVGDDSEKRRAAEIALPLVIAELKMRGVK